MKLFVGIVLLLWCGLAIARKLKGADTFFNWQFMATREIGPQKPITFYFDLIFLFGMISSGMLLVVDFFK